MHKFEVGKPYNPKLRMPSEDCWHYNWRGGQHELVCFMSRPTMQEVQEIRCGKVEFALLTPGDLIVLALRFGKQEWADATYSIHLAPAEEAALPDPGDEEGEKRRLVQIYLVDRASGILQVIRAVTLSPEFTAALHTAIRAQAARPWLGLGEHNRQVDALYQHYPSSAALVRESVARCAGGQ